MISRAAVLHKPLIAVAGAPDMKSFYRDWAGHEITNITGIIKRGYYSGQTNQQILRQVIGTRSAGYADGRLGVAKRHMDTLIRTSVQHAANVARQETYAANDDIIFGYQIVATLDDRTSAVCQSMDGMIFPNDGENHPAPPFHPGCRTTSVPVLDPAFADLEKGATRIAKGADGTEIVDANETYFSWLSKQPPEFQDAAIGPRRGELLRNGGLTAERFRELNMNRNFEPRTLAEMKELEPLAFARAGHIGIDDLNREDRAQFGNKAVDAMIKDEGKNIHEMIAGGKYSDRDSKWNGTVKITNSKKTGGYKDWNCDIAISRQQPPIRHSLVHEHLHARSVSFYTPKEYVTHKGFEEGAVELFAREICNREGIKYIDNGGAYQSLVESLRTINKHVGGYNSDFDFAKDLFAVPMIDRESWLKQRIGQAISNGNIKNDADKKLLDGAVKKLRRGK